MASTYQPEALQEVAFTTTTPFSEDGTEVRYDAAKENVEYLADHGARLFVPCGNTGEYYSLTDDERVRMVEATVEATPENCTVVGGVGGSTKEALELTRRYEDAGADLAMIMHPIHTYIHHQALRDYYEAIASATDLGIVLYKRGPEIRRSLIADLSTRADVVGVKYAVNDIKGFARAVSTVPGELVWMNGIAERYAPSFALEGATGVTTGIGNFAPEATLALFEALEAHEWERAKAIRDAIRPFEDLREEAGAENDLAAANNVPAVKFAMDEVGLYGGPVREPLTELSEPDRQRASEYLERMQSYEPSNR